MPVSVHAEITDDGGPSSRGWILYDGDCALCLKWVERLGPILRSRGFSFAPLQAAWVRERLRLPDDQLLLEMRVLLLPSGKSLGGADAIVEIAKRVWWAWPLVAVAQIPGVRPVLRRMYQRVAERRYRLDGTCAIRSSKPTPQERSQLGHPFGGTS